MGWRRRPEDDPGDEGDEPAADAEPPRRGQHYGYHPGDAECGDAECGVAQPGDDEQQADPEGASGPASADDVPSAGGASRDGRLAWFAVGGQRAERPPSAELAALLASLAGPGWRCPGGTAAELVTMAGRWAAVESWAGAGKLGVVRELVRRQDKPRQPADGDEPGPWTESLTHELALALASSAGAADALEWLAWELGTRLPGIGALLEDGTLTCGKAKIIAETFRHLTDAHAAHAEALILGRLAGKTWTQVQRLAAWAAARADPAGTERRRKEAEKKHARVRLWREQSGAAGLGGFDLPTDQALAAHDNVTARAGHYKNSGAFPGAHMDQLRAMAYLDLLNSVTAEDRITGARTPPGPDNPTTPARPDDPPPWEEPDDPPGPASPVGPDDPATAQATADKVPADGQDDEPPDDDGTDDDDSDSGGGEGGDGGGEDGPDPGSPPRPGPAPDPGPRVAARPGTDLIIPLVTLLGLGNRPGEAYRLGPLDPGLCRQLAALAANSLATEFCLTITDHHGYAIGHGCARARARPCHGAVGAPLAALSARVNLTIPLVDLQALTSPAGRESRRDSQGSRGDPPWALAPRGDPGPPGGYGTWTLTIPGGREFTVRLEPVPTFDCDHVRESRGYQPSDPLRHLVQVRDGECTFPTCTRHARESDFEHAVPYHKGGRTCACNAGARSRKCHRIKQVKGWNVTQPRPGWHQWTTPTGHTYVQGPKRYPAL